MASKYKILITGIAGFLGSHLSEKLIDLGHTVVGIDNMVGGYKDNIPKDIEFHDVDCCDFQHTAPSFCKILRGVMAVGRRCFQNAVRSLTKYPIE